MAVNVYQAGRDLSVQEAKIVQATEHKPFALPILRLPSLPEYPGSLKSINGEGGWWRLEEYLSYKIDQGVKRRGERL